MRYRALLLLALLIGTILVAPISAQAPNYSYPNPDVEPWWWTGELLSAMDLDYQAAYVAGALDAFVAFSTVATKHAEWMLILGQEAAMRAYALTTHMLLTATVAIPPTATMQDILSRVAQHLDSNPQSKELNAALLIWRALAETQWE